MMTDMQPKKMRGDRKVETDVLKSFDMAVEAAKEEFKACHFLRALNQRKHGGCGIYLENKYTL